MKTSIQLSSKSVTQEASHATPQLPLEYHKCTICSTSFSSINRLLSHSQMATCGKSSCNHCEAIFDSKNKLHDHIRSHECQKLLLNKSDAAIKTALTKLFTPGKNAISDVNTAIMKAGIEYSTHVTVTPVSAVKSIAPHKSSLSALALVESTTPKATETAEFSISSTSKTSTSATKSLTPHDSGLSSLSTFEKNVTNDANTAIIKARIKYSTHVTITTETPLSTYRSVSPPPPTYEIATPKTCLTIADLYMRYASSSKLQARSKITRIITVLPIMFIQDLYKKFHNKKKRVILTSSKTLDSPSSMRPGKTSDMLFLNDLNSSEVFQKVRLGFIFRYHQSRSLRDSLFNNNVISSLSSMTPFLIYA